MNVDTITTDSALRGQATNLTPPALIPVSDWSSRPFLTPRTINTELSLAEPEYPNTSTLFSITNNIAALKFIDGKFQNIYFIPERPGLVRAERYEQDQYRG